MSWTLEQAKKILGITGSDQDEEIQGVMDTTLAAIETVLQRGLLEQEDTQFFQDLIAARIQLRRFPVKEVATVDGQEMSDRWVLNSEGGWIRLPETLMFDNMTIVYTGGYATLPFDLERAMWEAFVYLWGETQSVTGNPEGGIETDPTGASGEVSRVTIQDFGSVTYDTGASLSGEAASKATQRVLDWGWLAPWASTLQFYRGEHGIGLGMA